MECDNVADLSMVWVALLNQPFAKIYQAAQTSRLLMHFMPCVPLGVPVLR